LSFNCRDFIANDERPPIHPTSIRWIIRVGGNAATEANNSFKMHFSRLVYLTGERHWQRC